MAKAVNRAHLAADRAMLWEVQRRERAWREFAEVRDVEFRTDFVENVLSVIVRFSNGCNKRHVFSLSELYMEGSRSFFHWLHVVDQDVVGMAYEIRRRERQHQAVAQMVDMIETTPVAPFFDFARIADDYFYQLLGRVPAGPLVQINANENLQSIQDFPSRWTRDRDAREAADKKSRELFRNTAGDEAYQTLESGKPLPLTGSNGTQYTLHKRASFCIERVSDGAKFCAVVPGVPLFDHLLGIKLIVERDEDAFLKTANVAAGDPFGLRPGRIWYVNTEADLRACVPIETIRNDIA